MASFDVESLFTNIPLQKTIDLCVDLSFNDKLNIDGFTKTNFHELLTVTLSEPLILFNNEYYKQIDGIAMGSPLGPTLADIFLSYYEQIWLKNCPYDLNLSLMKDMLMTPSCYFDQKIILKNFEVSLIANILILSLHLRQKKTIPCRFSLLKLVGLIIVFSTNIYRKVTFNGVFTNFESFILISYKSNLTFTLSFRAFKLCSNFELFYQEILNVKDIFKRNGYPVNFIDVFIKRYLNQIFLDKKV